MKKYLDDADKIYVKTNEKMVYVVESISVYDSCNYLQLNLELVAGWDYINPDFNDVQGWCPANRFIDDVQSDIVNQYFIVESMKEALEENGYEIMEDVPDKIKNINS